MFAGHDSATNSDVLSILIYVLLGNSSLRQSQENEAQGFGAIDCLPQGSCTTTLNHIRFKQHTFISHKVDTRTAFRGP